LQCDIDGIADVSDDDDDERAHSVSQEVSLLQTEMQVLSPSLAHAKAESQSSGARPVGATALLGSHAESTHSKAASSIARALASLHRFSSRLGLTGAGTAIWVFLFLMIVVAGVVIFKDVLEERARAIRRDMGLDADDKSPAKTIPTSHESLASDKADFLPAGSPYQAPILPRLSADSSGAPATLSSRSHSTLGSSTLVAAPPLPSDEQIQASIRREAMRTAGIPPIAATLVLPHQEARFMVSKAQMDELRRTGAGSLSISGTSGKKLLVALVCKTPDGRSCLMVSSVGCEDDPRACIFTSRQYPSDLEIFGKAGLFYGWLNFSSRAEATLFYGGGAAGERSAVMNLSSKPQWTASSMDNQVIGSGTFVADSFRLQASPGTDAVLTVSCILALELLI